MAGRQCYHCKQRIDPGEPHDCWTTTETALTQDLGEDLQEAYARLRETAVEFGEQRIYASHSSIMFSRKACYFFVRPKKSFLEVCVFLGRTVHAPQVRKAQPASRLKVAHFLRIQHRDQVEPPITDWLREAYVWSAGSTPGRTPEKPARERTSGALRADRKKASPARHSRKEASRRGARKAPA